MKTLHNSDVNEAKKNVTDLVTFGNGDTFKLICKESSKSEGWMKSTKAMEVPGLGCVVQITTQQGEKVSEAACWVPGTTVVEQKNNDGVVVGRRVVSFSKFM
jgi:hypothetical protein